jgi:tryptophanyl-tRNA synthetase
MSVKTVLTGITPSGAPHLGNYLGMIKPAVATSYEEGRRFFYFISDHHALVKCHDPGSIGRFTLEIAAAWLALGLDTPRVFFYRQSRVPEILELHWILSCVAAKGLLNRAHAYKAMRDRNAAAGADADAEVSLGLFSYPVLMAADILMFETDYVPVGKDQVQHVEIARDIAVAFNARYGTHFELPRAMPGSGENLPGLDGRKMSKSYDNTIPIFCAPDELRRAILRIRTNSLAPGEPKDSSQCTLFQLYRGFAEADEVEQMQRRYAAGIGWGEVKELLIARIQDHLAGPRSVYLDYIAAPRRVEEALADGEARVRPLAQARLAEIRDAVGLGRLLAGR